MHRNSFFSALNRTYERYLDTKMFEKVNRFLVVEEHTSAI